MPESEEAAVNDSSLVLTPILALLAASYSKGSWRAHCLGGRKVGWLSQAHWPVLPAWWLRGREFWRDTLSTSPSTLGWPTATRVSCRRAEPAVRADGDGHRFGSAALLGRLYGPRERHHALLCPDADLHRGADPPRLYSGSLYPLSQLGSSRLVFVSASRLLVMGNPKRRTAHARFSPLRTWPDMDCWRRWSFYTFGPVLPYGPIPRCRAQ